MLEQLKSHLESDSIVSKIFHFGIVIALIIVIGLATLNADAQVNSVNLLQTNTPPENTIETQANLEFTYDPSLTDTLTTSAGDFACSPGVTMTQLTFPPSAHELSYYDIRAYSHDTSKAYVNRNRGSASGIWDILSIDPTSNAQQVIVSRTVPSSFAARFDLSSNGRLISYMRMNDAPETGFDLYGYRLPKLFNYLGNYNYKLTRVGEFRITWSNYPVDTIFNLTSPATWELATRQYVLVYGIGSQLYVVRENGTWGNEVGPHPVVLNDPDNTLPFHRIRLNPIYPHIIFYRREDKSVDPSIDPKIYVADLRSEPVKSVRLFKIGGGVFASHPGWVPNGKKIAVAGVDWMEFPVIDEFGGIVGNLDYTKASGREVGSKVAEAPNFSSITYGTYSPDGKWLALATQSNKKSPGELYLVDRKLDEVHRLCRTNFFGKYGPGQPRMSFVGYTGKILLSTDNSWGQVKPSLPQVYIVDPGIR